MINMLSEPVQLALILAVPTTLTAIGGIFLAIRTSRKVEKVRKETTEVKEQTNGHLSTMSEQLRIANQTIANLREQLEFVFGDDKAKAARRRKLNEALVYEDEN